MADSWQSDICGRYFDSTKNRIGLARKFRNGTSRVYPYQDICIDFELYDKKMTEKRRRNHDTRNLLLKT